MVQELEKVWLLMKCINLFFFFFLQGGRYMFMCKEERLQMLAFWFARGKKNVEYFEVNVGMKLFFFFILLSYYNYQVHVHVFVKTFCLWRGRRKYIDCILILFWSICKPSVCTLFAVIRDILRKEISNKGCMAVIATSLSRTSIHPLLVTSRGTHFLQELIRIDPPDKVH